MKKSLILILFLSLALIFSCSNPTDIEDDGIDTDYYLDSNNDINNATVLNEDLNQEGIIDNLYDTKDYYSTSVVEGLSLKFSFEITSEIKVNFLDNDGNSIQENVISTDQDINFIPDFDGNLFLELSTEKKDVDYKISMINETENNSNFISNADNFGNAYTINADTNYFSKIENNDEVYFKFNVNESKLVRIQANSIIESKFINLSLFDDGMNEIKNNSNKSETSFRYVLSSGTYYIKLNELNNEALEYCRIFYSLIDTNDDYEPNNSFENSYEIIENQTYNGTINEDQLDSTDYFKLSNNGIFRLNLSVSLNNSSNNFEFSLYDENKNQIHNENFTQTENSYNQILDAGTYYIKFDTTSSSDIDYIVSFTKDLDDSHSPNHDFIDAILISEGENISGTILCDLEDYYKITSNDEFRLNLNVTSDNTNANFKISLYDENENFIETKSLNEANNLFQRTLCQYNTYYIKLSSEDEDVNYTLNYTRDLNDSYEPFGNFADAVSISENEDISGIILGQESDFFKFSCDENFKLELSCSLNSGKKIKVKLYDENENFVKQIYVNPGNTDNLATEILEAGTYYIEVCNNYSTDNQYDDYMLNYNLITDGSINIIIE